MKTKNFGNTFAWIFFGCCLFFASVAAVNHYNQAEHYQLGLAICTICISLLGLFVNYKCVQIEKRLRS